MVRPTLNKCHLIDAHLMSPETSGDAAPDQRYGYRFGGFRLYPVLRVLFRGNDRVEIGQTAFSFILFMIENAGRPLRKAEIFAGVWDRQHIGEATFRNYLTIFRDLFGRDSLITLKTRGYQCALSVERIADQAPEPPSPMPETVRHNLPPRAGAGIGRAAELGAAADALAQDRALTILGPGGIGKTWLAVELGWRLAPDYPGGVHLVDLAPVRDAEGIGSAVAKVLGVALWGAKATFEAIIAALRDRPKLLLVFDSCDYVAKPAGSVVAGLLKRTTNVSVLATSQEVLHIAGERILRLGPLPLDDAIALIDARAHATDHRFRRDAGDRERIGEICCHLDGVPHALELVGARMPELGIEGVITALASGERFEMLTNGPQTAESRQRTLLATVEWSYGLLDDADRRIFRRLSCFTGSFSREAAFAIVGPVGATRWQVTDALRRLADKSLLTYESGEQPRYRLLETLQQFGAAKLKEDGEADILAERHLEYFQSLFEPADEAWETMPDAEWVKRYGLEIDNVRAALDWALAKPERTRRGVALCGVTGRLWYMLNLVPEGREYCDRFVELIDSSIAAADAARLLRYGGSL